MKNVFTVIGAFVRAGIVMALSAVSSHAQDVRFLYPVPSSAVSVSKNVQYGISDTATLRMDVYRPSAPASGSSPALIFFNGAFGPDRDNSFYSGWARAAASQGLVAIVPDLHSDRAAQNFDALVAHLSQHASSYGIDSAAIAVYAGSGNVYTAFPIVEDPARTTVKAAVMYYGTAPITTFRRDLPVLFVRAGLDRPSVTGGPTSGMIGLAARAISQNAPVTLLNDPAGHHGFEIVDDDAATRDAIDRTIDFVKRATNGAYQTAIRRGLLEATAASQVVTGDFHAAAASYEQILTTRPDDLRLRLSYGEALLGDRQFAAACAALEPLKGKGLGARDLGIPGALACAQKGDPDAAIAFLKTIPKQYLPSSTQNEPAFAALRERADFRALFQP